MGAGKNKSHRKKRISKHVLQAAERRDKKAAEETLLAAAERKDGADGGEGPSSSPSTSAGAAGGAAGEKEGTSPTPSSKRERGKDPSEAASYLALWQHDQTSNNTKQWKFNKNTQSWLFRHMYDFDKVSKATFGILVEYICNGGEGARNRVEEEAKRRARRYKHWEKGQKVDGEEGGGAEAEDAEKPPPSADDAPWDELDEHDKRKEYKRARKVLDALKAVREKQ